MTDISWMQATELLAADIERWRAGEPLLPIVDTRTMAGTTT